MTTQQEEKAKKFFALLASHGITEVLCIKPPEGGSVNAKIHANRELERDGKRKKIKPN